MKTLLLIMLSLVLAGCGSHGYEGKYEGTVDLLLIQQKWIVEITGDQLSLQRGNQTESAEIEDAEVRKEDGKEYLVITEEGGGETYFQIIDDDTLILDLDIVQVKLERI